MARAEASAGMEANVAIINASSTQTLLSALAQAKPGDVIRLASGTYANVAIKGLNIAGNVTIMSADASRPAVLLDLSIKSSQGLTFSNLTFSETKPSSDYGFTVSGSSNIQFDHLKVSGPANIGSGAESSLMQIRSSTGVTVSNSEFSNGNYAISLIDTSGTVIKGNFFHDIRTDGVRGGGNSNITISGNLFTDFYPAAGDHSDAIQLWTTNTSATARNIVITDNVVVRGDGRPIQGVFLRDTFDQMPFENVTVTGNLVVGGVYNGISVDGATSGLIANNEVYGLPDQRSSIRTGKAGGVVVRDNVATDYVSDLAELANTNGNRVVLSASDKGSSQVYGWAASHSLFGKNWAASPAQLLSLLDLPAYSGQAQRQETAIVGSAADDRLAVAAVGNSTVDGGAGSDVIMGGGAAGTSHILRGGAGDDVYILKSVSETVIELANGGNDTVRVGFDYTLPDFVENLRLDSGGLTGTGNALANRISGSIGDDRIFSLAGDDMVQGADGNDQISGGDGRDTLRGDAGNDSLFGERDDDMLYGGDGNDILSGGAGADILEGGAGSDQLTGGAGADMFRLRPDDLGAGSVDTITDFTRGTDVIALNLIDANANSAATNDAFRFIGTRAFSGTAGELRFDVSGGHATVYGDVNGDRVADFVLIVQNQTTLSANDFIL